MSSFRAQTTKEVELLDSFAIAAMASMLAETEKTEEDVKVLAHAAYEVATLMVKERRKYV